MPFTFSHPALVLPFMYLPKRWVSVTGLVLGSIIPDFEKFIKMRAGHTYSHTLSGLFLFDLPLALLLAFLFHGIVRNTLVDSLPAFLQKRLVVYKNFDWRLHFRKYYPQVIISILVGAFSHVALDSFTHHGGRFVQYVPYLQRYFFIGDVIIYYYKVLDILFTIAGAAIIIFSIAIMRDHPISVRRYNIKIIFWLSAFSISLVIILLRFLLGEGLRHVWDLANLLIAASLISITVSALLLKKKTNEH